MEKLRAGRPPPPPPLLRLLARPPSGRAAEGARDLVEERGGRLRRGGGREHASRRRSYGGAMRGCADAVASLSDIGGCLARARADDAAGRGVGARPRWCRGGGAREGEDGCRRDRLAARPRPLLPQRTRAATNGGRPVRRRALQTHRPRRPRHARPGRAARRARDAVRRPARALPNASGVRRHRRRRRAVQGEGAGFQRRRPSREVRRGRDESRDEHAGVEKCVQRRCAQSRIAAAAVIKGGKLPMAYRWLESVVNAMRGGARARWPTRPTATRSCSCSRPPPARCCPNAAPSFCPTACHRAARRRGCTRATRRARAGCSPPPSRARPCDTSPSKPASSRARAPPPRVAARSSPVSPASSDAAAHAAHRVGAARRPRRRSRRWRQRPAADRPAGQGAAGRRAPPSRAARAASRRPARWTRRARAPTTRASRNCRSTCRASGARSA